jgi:pimeloyl-ACP methyl ester carboxylesterase
VITRECKFKTAHQSWSGLSFSSDIHKSTSASKPILCLHGWLDNAASFAPMAPELLARLPRGTRILSLDLPGHGKSAWRRGQLAYPYTDWIALLHDLFRHEGWSSATLIGHSLGGTIACVFASLFPHLVERLVLIDVFGPVPQEATKAKAQLKDFCEQSVQVCDKAKTYRNFESLVQARAMAELSPMSLESARHLMKRNSQRVGKFWRTRTDPKLKFPSSVKMTWEQAHAIVQGLACPTLLLRNEATRENPYWKTYAPTMSSCTQLRVVDQPGGHHLHMESPVMSAELLASFLRDQK